MVLDHMYCMECDHFYTSNYFRLHLKTDKHKENVEAEKRQREFNERQNKRAKEREEEEKKREDLEDERLKNDLKGIYRNDEDELEICLNLETNEDKFHTDLKKIILLGLLFDLF